MLSSSLPHALFVPNPTYFIFHAASPVRKMQGILNPVTWSSRWKKNCFLTVGTKRDMIYSTHVIKFGWNQIILLAHLNPLGAIHLALLILLKGVHLAHLNPLMAIHLAFLALRGVYLAHLNSLKAIHLALLTLLRGVHLVDLNPL